MKSAQIVRYWVDSSEVDYRAMETLFAEGHYVWALFVCHLVIEKLLKALHMHNLSAAGLQIHNLPRIAESAGLQRTDEQQALLDDLTAFNIQARYPDYKNRFYRKANNEFTQHYLARIKDFRQWILQRITG